MSVSVDLRLLLRERLTAVMDQVLTQVLLELDQTLEDYAANTHGQKEPLKAAISLNLFSAGVQFPEPQIKEELQKESHSISEVQRPESPQVEESYSLSAAANVEEFNEIQIASLTSLNTFTSLSASKDLNSNLGLNLERGEQTSDMQQSFSCAPCIYPDVHVKQEPKGSTCDLSGLVQVEEIQINCVASLNTSLRQRSSEEINQNMDTEMERECVDQQQSDSTEYQDFSENNMKSTSPDHISNQITPNALGLKVPVIKLYRIPPKSDSKKKRQKISKDTKNIPTKEKKKGINVEQKAIKYMCYCEKLFTKEALEIHKMSHDGQDRPFGCPFAVKPPLPLSRSTKRRYEALNVRGSNHTVEESERFTLGRRKVPEHKKSGAMEVFPDERDEAQSCEDTNLRYFKENFLLKSNTAHPNEKNKVCEKDAAGPLIKQISAPLGFGAEGEASETSAPFSCDVCGRGFSWLPGLYEHRRNHFDTGTYWCPDCGRTFSNVLNLRKHVCVQTGNRPYSCSVCKETFFLRIHLENHMKQHNSVRKQASGSMEKDLKPEQYFYFNWANHNASL